MKLEKSVKFEDFIPEHTEELVTMWRASFEKALAITDPHPIGEQIEYFKHEVEKNNNVQIAKSEGKIVGFVAATPNTITQLYVHVSYQRLGIGTKLLNWAKELSRGKLWLYTFDRNESAKSFYESQGFSIISRGFEEQWQLADVKYEWLKPKQG